MIYLSKFNKNLQSHSRDIMHTRNCHTDANTNPDAKDKWDLDINPHSLPPLVRVDRRTKLFKISATIIMFSTAMIVSSVRNWATMWNICNCASSEHSYHPVDPDSDQALPVTLQQRLSTYWLHIKGVSALPFSYFSTKTYLVDNHLKRFAEALLMHSYKLFFWRNKKNIHVFVE